MKDAIDRFITLTERKKAIKNSLDEVNTELAGVEAEIAQTFRDNGTSKITRNGVTVHLIRHLSVRNTAGTAATVAALRKARLGDLLMASSQRMKAWIKEKMENRRTGTWEVNLKKLPPSLRKVVSVEEYYKIGVRKS